MYRQIDFTVFGSPFVASARGRHRRQARYPARSAASGDGKNRTFSRLGRRAAHEGLQYTPVLETAKKNFPS